MFIMAAVCHFAMYMQWTDLTLLKFIASCIAGTFVYLAAMILFGMIRREDMSRVPWINKFFRDR
jgi:hypothetical protein